MQTKDHDGTNDSTVGRPRDASASAEMQERLATADEKRMTTASLPAEDEPAHGAQDDSSHDDLAEALRAACTRAEVAEQALRRIEERLAALQTASSQWMWSTNAAGLIEGDVGIGRVFTGQSVEDMQGRGWTEAVHPDDRERAQVAWDQAVSTASAYEGIHRVRRGDGAYRHLLVRGVPVFETDGGVREWVGTATDVTEQVEREEALRRQASILNRTHDAVFIWELGGPIILWNRGAEMLYGFSADEAIGRISDDLLKTAHPMATEAFEEMLAREGEWAGELTHITRDGQPVTILSRHQLLVEPDGRRYVLETSRDITERKRLEGEVAARARQLEAIFEAVADGLVIYDETGSLREWNAALAALFEFDLMPDYATLPVAVRPSGIQVRDEYERPIPAEQLPFMRAIHGETLTGQHAVDLTVTVPSGRIKNVNASAAALRDEAGRVTGSVTVYRDITERKRLEMRTREALDALLAMAEALVTSDAEGPQVAPLAGDAPRNGAVRGQRSALAQRLAALACDVLGCSRVSLIAVEPTTRELRAIAVVGLSPEQERRWWDEQEQLERQGQRLGEGADASQLEQLARFEAGEPIILDMRQPPYDALPNPYGITTTLTVPMRTGSALVGILSLDYGGPPHTFTAGEQALASAVAKLAALVIERERLIREAASAQARALMAEQARQEQDDFLHLVTHELRSPLTSVRLNLQIVRRRALGLGEAATAANLPTLIERAEQQAERLSRMVEDLVQAARIQANKLTVEPSHVALDALVDLVRERVQEQRLANPTRTIHARLLAPDQVEPLTVDMDSERIGQVLINFLTNAIKYSPSDTPITVSMRHDATHVRVSVKDAGPGLPLDEQGRIWERFHQVDGIEAVGAAGVGLGLGLYICRSIVALHGGEVGVRSQVGKGSTFWFSLPLGGAEAR